LHGQSVNWKDVGINAGLGFIGGAASATAPVTWSLSRTAALNFSIGGFQGFAGSVLTQADDNHWNFNKVSFGAAMLEGVQGAETGAGGAAFGYAAGVGLRANPAFAGSIGGSAVVSHIVSVFDPYGTMAGMYN
jgi:hypothetical protein